MELLPLIQFGTPVLLLGMIILVARIDAAVRDLRDDMKEMKDNAVYRDTCDATHRAVDNRLYRLDRITNGSK